MHKKILFLFLTGFSAIQSMAQQSLSVATNITSSSIATAGKFYYGDRSEPARAIEFNPRTVTASAFLSDVNQYFNIPADFNFIETESNADNVGMHHHLLQQYYKGVLIEGLGYRAHEKNGYMTSANGRAVRSINLAMQVTVSEEQAFTMAVQFLHTKDSVFRHGKKLIVSKDFTFTPESFSVAYQFDLDVSLIERWRISIDANTGQVVNKVSLVNSCGNDTRKRDEPKPLPYSTGTGLTRYYGTKTIRIEQLASGSRLVGQTEHGGIIGTYNYRNAPEFLLLFGLPYTVSNFYSDNNTFNTSYTKPAVSVQWAAEHAFEYYFKKHNRNSYDNKGSAITSYVHVGEGLNNAFWTGSLLAFGDGSNNNNPLVELDVVSHELTHGVTQHEADLQYSYEPGALNESFSDIFAKAVEFYAFGDSATWQLARQYQPGGLRDVSNPNLRNQPDTYLGDLWHTGYEDSGGVHYNSGVQNYWFYLLCEGGSGINDHHANYAVAPIGMDKAINIAYRNLTEYLTTSSNYLDSRIGSLLATADLYGRNSNVYQEVDKAWDAVGVIDEPIITSLEVYDITATTIKIKGSMLPRGNNATYHFEYGTTPALGSSSSIYPYTTTNFESNLSGLQAETKYYLRLVTTNENGNSYNVVEFTTLSLAPLVKIKHTIDVTETTAVLYGQVNPNSLTTSYYFEYGTTQALGLVTPSYPASDTTVFVNISAPVANLQPRQTYYFRLVAFNGSATSKTVSSTLFTATKPVVTSFSPIAAAIGTEVTITGQNFNSKKEQNVVSFGATRGKVVSSTSTEIKVKVPAGASFGVLSILDLESGLAAESVQEFVPTFTGEFRKKSLKLTTGINDPYIYKVLVQDMDGDAKPDIVASYSQGLVIYQNVNQGGDITNESFVRSTFPSDYTNTSDIFVSDFDGNGLHDVVMRYQKGLRIHPNLSVPGYIFFGTPVDLPIGYWQNLIFDDFDMDGHIDIAGTNSLRGDSSKIMIIRNKNPKGILLQNHFEQPYLKLLPHRIEHLTSGDLNNDGTPDLMAGSNFRDFLSILLNNSSPGGFGLEENIVDDPTRGDRYIRYISHDLNQDGKKDIVSHSMELPENLSIMENTGTTPKISLSTPSVILKESATAVQAGDIDGDGKVDLLASLSNRKFIFFKNKITSGENLTASSFDMLEEYGTPIVDAGSGSVKAQSNINDLNGDGTPEIINTYMYNYAPRDGNLMEIWQYSPRDCMDASGVSVSVTNLTATIMLPPNTTFDQFEIYYKPSNYSWTWVGSTSLQLQSRETYQLRVRAKCHLDFSDYFYLNFTPDCVNTNIFSITNIGVNAVTLYQYNLNSMEVQYAQAGKDQWLTLPQNVTQITNLLSGTTYDVRIRGRCAVPAQFKYSQFTTLCAKLSTLTVSNIIYNSATAIVNGSSNHNDNVIMEYSPDNITWTLLNDTRIMSPLTPGKNYFVRARMACANANSDFLYTSFVAACPKASALSVNSVTPFSAKIAWVDESNTNSYVVMYAIAPNGIPIMAQTKATSFTLLGLNPGTQYKIQVAPQCITSKDFTTISFNTVCYAPFDLSVNSITHTSGELSWSENFSGVPYTVEYSVSGSNVWQTTQTALTTLLLSNLRPGTNYEARVHITCPSEKAPYASLNFETNLYEATTFAPNPTNKDITIYPSRKLIGNRFSIHDNTGRQVYNATLLNYTIDLSMLSPGIYVLRIDGEKLIKISKY